MKGIGNTSSEAGPSTVRASFSFSDGTMDVFEDDEVEGKDEPGSDDEAEAAGAVEL